MNTVSYYLMGLDKDFTHINIRPQVCGMFTFLIAVWICLLLLLPAGCSKCMLHVLGHNPKAPLMLAHDASAQHGCKCTIKAHLCYRWKCWADPGSSTGPGTVMQSTRTLLLCWPTVLGEGRKWGGQNGTEGGWREVQAMGRLAQGGEMERRSGTSAGY